MAMVEATLTADGTVRVAGRPVKSRGDWSRADAADERELVRQKAADDAETRADAAAWTRDLRARLHLTQDTFAARLGVPVATVRNWEQGKRQPRGAARVLLRVIAREPDAVRRALAAEWDAVRGDDDRS